MACYRKKIFKAILSSKTCFLYSSFLSLLLLINDITLFAEQAVQYTDIGQTRVYFHRSPLRNNLIKNLIRSINHNNLLFTTRALENSDERKIIPIATKYSDVVRDILDDSPLAKDSHGRPVYPDPVGHALLDEFAMQAQLLTESQMKIAIEGLSRDLCLNISQDGLVICREQFQRQIDYLRKQPNPSESYLLFQEIILADWQMAPGTFSAHLIQDEVSRDRFLITLFPGEIMSLFFAHPVTKAKACSSSSPIQTIIAPLDYSAPLSPGSWKGKSIHTSIKGIVKEKDMQQSANKAVALPINSPKIEKYDKELKRYYYPNGIVCTEFADPLPIVQSNTFQKHIDLENLTILESPISGYSPILSKLQKICGIKGNLVQVLHVFKRDEGFSRLSPLCSLLPQDAEVLIINRSALPEGYKHYAISEDFTEEKLPWIQLYCLPPNKLMKISTENLKKLSLTPPEEVFCRNDISSSPLNGSDINKKFSHKIDILIFSRCL